MDNGQILLTKELLGSKKIDKSLQLQEVFGEGHNQDKNSNQKLQEKEHQPANETNAHTEEEGRTEELNQQESSEEFQLKENIHSNENKEISKDPEKLQTGKISLHPPGNEKNKSPVGVKPKNKADDVTETATEGDDGEVPDDYYDRCENTDVEITATNSQGI